MRERLTHAGLAGLLLCLAACGGRDADTPPAEVATGAPADAATPAPATAAPEAVAPQSTADAPIALADLDAYARGVQAEIDALRASADKVKQPRTAKDTNAETAALLEMTSPDIEAAGAKASGLDPARYAAVKQSADTVFGKLDTLHGLEAMTADAGEMTAEMRKEVEANRASLEAQLGDPYAGLPPDVAAALKARHDTLAQLRAQAIGVRASVL